MKKLILTITIIFSMCVGASAQRDGFFGCNEMSGDRFSADGAPAMPTSPIGSTNNESAPLGSGLLIMATLGAGYALTRKKA